MKESFDEYRSVIESNIQRLSYIYNGDIISHFEDSYSETMSTKRESPIFIINTLDNIYEWSVKRMMEKSIEIIKVYDFKNKDGLGDWLSKIIEGLDIEGFKPANVFISDIKLLGIDTMTNKNRPLPNYFYEVKNTYFSKFKDKLIFYKNPYMEPKDDEVILYITDKSIQSLVYMIQNMDYIINGNNHTLKYNIYECDYSCYKLVIKDLSKMRDDKINSLLF